MTHFACCKKAASWLQAKQKATRTSSFSVRFLLAPRPQEFSCRASLSVISSVGFTRSQRFCAALSHPANGGQACTGHASATLDMTKTL